jgi:hypothetical protein
MRDSRINRIFEGSSEIMHLFMAREAVDKHLAVAGPLADPGAAFREKAFAALRALRFYALWYPRLWLRWSGWPRFRAFGGLAPHLRFVDRATRKLARSVFHGMLVHRAALERRQAFLFRIVDIAMSLFAMTAVVVRAHRMRTRSTSAGLQAESLADLFCRSTRRETRERFHALWANDDALRRHVGLDVMSGQHLWLESGIVGLRRRTESLVPASPLGPDSGKRPVGTRRAIADDSLQQDEERAAWEGMIQSSRR